jgi:cytochrome P450
VSELPKIKGFQLLKWFALLLWKPLSSLEKVVRKKGKVVEFNGGKYQKLYFVSDPTFVKHILKTNKDNYKRAPVIKALKPLLGDGIFISEDQTWKSQRDALKPAFHEKVVQQFEEVIVAETGSLIKRWSEAKHPIQIEKDIELLMLRILFETQFCKSIEVDYNEIQRAHFDVLKQTSIRNQKIFFYVNRLRKGIGLQSVQKSPSPAIVYLHTVAKHVVAFGINNRNDCSYWLNDMLDSELKESEITDQILNFIFAGYDTTASVLSWSLYCLATNTEHQQICREEVLNTPITFTNLSTLSYTKQCLQESMRLYPPVWSIHRQSVAEDTIEGHVFAPDSYFMICGYTMHRDPDYWENPSDFKPSRFSSDNMRGKAFQYIPFGQGERLCIGQSLATMEAQIILGLLLKQFKFSYSKNRQPSVTPGIIMKSAQGIELDIESIS